MAGSYESNKRWREKHPEKWAAQKRRNYERGAAARTKQRRIWTNEQDISILVKIGPEDRDLAAELGCSVQAIQARRSKLRKALGALDQAIRGLFIKQKPQTPGSK
jgi:FixJ family two-component response regulator